MEPNYFTARPQGDGGDLGALPGVKMPPGCGSWKGPGPPCCCPPHDRVGPGTAPGAAPPPPPPPAPQHHLIKSKTPSLWHNSPPLHRTGPRTLRCRRIHTPQQPPGRCPHSGRGWLHRRADTWGAEKRVRGGTCFLPCCLWLPQLPSSAPQAPFPGTEAHPFTVSAWLGPAGAEAERDLHLWPPPLPRIRDRE